MASSQLNPAINWEASNLEEEWKNFEEHTKLMFMGPLKKTSAEEQSAYLRIWIGKHRSHRQSHHSNRLGEFTCGR